MSQDGSPLPSSLENKIMESIKIDDAEIILQELGEGKGKIIITASYGYNFSCFWGAMGGTLKEFLLNINESYFVQNLADINDTSVFDGKATITNVRRHIREEMSYELPWYENMEAMKSLREELKKLEGCDDERYFVQLMEAIPDKVDSYSIEDSYDRYEFINNLKSLCHNEPWNFIAKKPSQKSLFLIRLFPKLQKKLKSL